MLVTAIGVQVRLSSERLPEKSIYKIDDKTIVVHLLDRVRNSILWMDKRPNRRHLRFHLYLLVPEAERDYWERFIEIYNIKYYSDVKAIFGDMENVFSRYCQMAEECKPDYVVRLTADCPFIPPPAISKGVNIAIRENLDYVTNAFPGLRTMPDGYDIEILSERAFSWLTDNIKNGDDSDLEHVTTYLTKNYPEWMKIALLSTNLDQSKIKYSVDTKEDYDDIKGRYLNKVTKDRAAIKRGFAVYEY